MDDRRKKRVDRRRVNMGQDYEVRWWTAAFGVTKAQLAKAVAAVGVEVKHVREYFFGKVETAVPLTKVVNRKRKVANRAVKK